MRKFSSYPEPAPAESSPRAQDGLTQIVQNDPAPTTAAAQPPAPELSVQDTGIVSLAPTAEFTGISQGQLIINGALYGDGWGITQYAKTGEETIEVEMRNKTGARLFARTRLDRDRWLPPNFAETAAQAYLTAAATRTLVTYVNKTSAVQTWVTGTSNTVTFNDWMIFDYSRVTDFRLPAQPPLSEAQRQMEAMRKRRAAVARNHRGAPLRAAHRERAFAHISQPEVLALQLLRQLVSQEEFRRFLRYGFVNTQGPSGLAYQIRRVERVRVWDRGQEIAQLCVHLKDPAPATDEVILKLLMAEADESALWHRSNVTWRLEWEERRYHPLLCRLLTAQQLERGVYVRPHPIVTCAA